MSVKLYGNINGNSYHAPKVNLFERAGKQDKQPVKFKDTEQGAHLSGVNLEISEEGLRVFHGGKLRGSANLAELEKDIEFMSEHQPIESFYHRFSQMMPSSYEKASNGEYTYVKHSTKEKAEILSQGYASIYNEISAGYAAGNRVRYIEDPTSEDRYRKLSKEDELSMLQTEFQTFVDQCQKQSDLAAKVLTNRQNLRERLGLAYSGF